MPQRMKNLAFSLLLIAVILPLNLAGCAKNTANPIAGGDTLVQISTIDAVLNGLYDGVTDFKTLRTYGDFGIGTFQVFTEPYIMTGGGPAQATYFLPHYIWDNAFRYLRMGYACALAWILVLIILALTLLAFRLSRHRVYYAGR